MILTVAIFFAWDVIGGQTKSYVITEVNQNSRFIISTISKDMRQANILNSVSETVLDIDLLSGDNIVYTFDDLANTISRQVNAGDIIVLNSAVVNVAGIWEDLSTAQASAIGLDITITYNSESGHSDWESTLSTSTSFNLNLQ